MPRSHTVRAGLAAAGAVFVLTLTAVAPAHAESPRHRSELDLHAELDQISSGGSVPSDNVWAPALGADRAKPKGWILLIHGGGWLATGSTVVNATLASVKDLRERGWAVYDVDYGTGESSLPDVVADYESMRATLGDSAPICALGQSAGAELALLLAAHEPLLRCVISEAALDDLTTLPDQPAWAPAGVSADTGPEWTYDNLIVRAFGTSESSLMEWSPVSYVASIKAHMLLGGSTYDWVVPEQDQLAEMSARASPARLKTMLLDGELTADGAEPNFVHASITAAAAQRWLAAEMQLLDWESGSAEQAFTS